MTNEQAAPKKTRATKTYAERQAAIAQEARDQRERQLARIRKAGERAMAELGAIRSLGEQLEDGHQRSDILADVGGAADSLKDILNVGLPGPAVATER